MKHILITGKNSYIGNSVEKYLSQFKGEYKIDTISVRGNDWKKKDFSEYDVVFHVAGIAHSDSGKISKEKEKLYYSVNTDLTIEIAKKAKKDGVKQFIFMSSAIVYGNSSKIGKDKLITKDTPVSPANCYGDSKVQAENGLRKLESLKFKVAILRPPMIYGKGCKGNFATLAKMAEKLPVFPNIKNRRSMLYVGNLAEFIRLIIKNEESGTFWPANAECMATSEIVKKIAEIKGKNICMISYITWLVKFFAIFSALPNKAFGSLRYENKLSEYKENYQAVSIEDSIKESIK